MALNARVLVQLLILGVLAEQYVVQGTEPTIKQPGDKSCPLWRHPVEENGTQTCQCNNHLQDIVYCDNATQEAVLADCYCMTTSETQEIEVGKCIYNCVFTQSKNGMINNYIPLPNNISELNNQTCDHFNRQGRLCGQCKDNHYPPVYSYSLKCQTCTGSYNWLKYIAVAFLPQTIFFILVVSFRISVTSPQLNAFVLLAQAVAAPYTTRAMLRLLQGEHTAFLAAKILLSLYGIWNLDFFRTLIPGICLHVNTLEALALDYVIAVYPLVLTIICYAILQLYSSDFRFIKFLHIAFEKCCIIFRDKLESRTSIIDAFATFLLLSYVKLLSVSFDLLVPTQVFNATGHKIGLYLYYDASVEYFGKQHLPYAITALAVVLVFILLPLLLLMAFPMKCFQRRLEKYNLESQVLRTFMDAFQGYYKDGTDGKSYDCRYFPAVYLMVRILVFVIYSLTLDATGWAIVSIALSTLIIAVIIAQPYKQEHSRCNKIDATLMLLLTIWISFVLCSDLTTARSVKKLTIYHAFCAIVALLPMFYMSFITVKWIITREKIKAKLKIVFKARRRDQYMYEEVEGENSFLEDMDRRNQTNEAASYHN